MPARAVRRRGDRRGQEALTAGRSSAEDHGLAGGKDLGDLAKDAGKNKISGNVADVAKSALAADDSLHDRGGAEA